MSLVMFIYLADLLPNITTFMVVTGLFSLILSLFSFLFGLEYPGSKTSKYLNRALLYTVVAGLLVCVIPSKTTMYMMGAAVVGEDFIKSETGQKLKKLVESKIDQELEEISSKIVKEQK